jgi:hypothetical protein
MKHLAMIVFGVIVILATALLFAYPVMLLWNVLLPDLFGFKHIDLWQALGLLTLSGLLFKSSHTCNKK